MQAFFVTDSYKITRYAFHTVLMSMYNLYTDVLVQVQVL